MASSMYWLLVCILFVSTPYALADWWEPVIRYACDRNKGTLHISNTGQYNQAFPFSATDGTYSPWALVTYADPPYNATIAGTQSIQKTCRLNKHSYRVLLEPQVFNYNRLGRCGAAISGAVTLYRGRALLLKRTAFEQDCHDNLPVITTVEVNGKTGIVTLHTVEKQKFYQ
jgi:hypothetical protein